MAPASVSHSNRQEITIVRAGKMWRLGSRTACTLSLSFPNASRALCYCCHVSSLSAGLVTPQTSPCSVLTSTWEAGLIPHFDLNISLWKTWNIRWMFQRPPYIHHPKLYCHLASSRTLRSSIPLSTRQATSVFSMQFKEKCRHLYPPPYILQHVADSLECNIWSGWLSLKEYNIYK